MSLSGDTEGDAAGTSSAARWLRGPGHAIEYPEASVSASLKWSDADLVVLVQR